MDGECSDFLTELESWYARESGCYLLGCIGDTLQGLLDTSFGYHILQLAHQSPDLFGKLPGGCDQPDMRRG
jgi:hypothetical protein